MPGQVALQCRHFHAALQAIARNFHDVIQRTLNAVVNTANQAGPQLDAHGGAGALHRFTGPQARRLLIDLNRGLIAVHLDDLTDQAVTADAHHVEHVCVAHAFGDDQRAGYFFDRATAHS